MLWSQTAWRSGSCFSWNDFQDWIKNHWAVADYLQRSARHIASKPSRSGLCCRRTCSETSFLEDSLIPIIKRTSDSPYKWKIATAPLKNVANIEKTMPKNLFLKMVLKLLKREKHI